MVIPDEAIARGAEIVVYDAMGHQVWWKTIGDKERYSSAWLAWGRYAAQKTKWRVIDPNGQWGRWAASVAAGNRTRKTRGLTFRKAGANAKSLSRGWVQAASRMATVISMSHNRRRMYDQYPWHMWAETVGSNVAKRRGQSDRYNKKHST